MKWLLLIPSLAFAITIPEEPKYTGEPERVRQQFLDLFESSKKVNAPDGKKEARARIESALDWETVSLNCLGKKEWAKAGGKNRLEFQNTLKEVILRTAYGRLDKFWEGATPRFEKIEIKGSDGHIACRFYFPTEVFSIDYYVLKKGDRWLIYDLAYEDIRYSVNIHDQLEAFLKEKKMSDLLEKLRKRRDELAKG
ncbi:MAG: ABC transporter substrate-binding protein [Deltaproteobacteria bacterium]|nr:ABC transporter substrate-binding protein [Deltaproteobacteria bacterium]MBI3293277.1 ABC transporter substrate-binding protein [Deltaproteobacteria bacterium]